MLKKRLWLSLTPLALIPLVVACSEETRVDFLKNAEGTEITYTTHIHFSLTDVKKANQAEDKTDLIVGNFAATDVKSLFIYSFNKDEDSSFFTVDNKNPSRFIYLKKEKFQELLDSGKETLSIVTKATLENEKNKYIEQTILVKIDTVTEVEKIPLSSDENLQVRRAQELNIKENFNVQINLEPQEKGTVISNSETHPNRVSNWGAFDENQDTFYSPVELSEAEKSAKEVNGLASTPDIILEAKDPDGVYVSMLEAYFVANGIPSLENGSLFGVTYHGMDDQVIRVESIEHSRLDIERRKDDPSNYVRGIRYIPIYEKVKKITFSFIGQDTVQLYPYLSELKVMGQVLTNYNQEPGKLLSDHNFSSYLKSNNTLYNENNVIMLQNDRVSFNFKPDDLVKLKQIQLYKAPVAYQNESQSGPVWRIRQGFLSKYRYVVTFADKTKVGFDIAGTALPMENFQLPEKYHDKIVLAVELVSDTLMELKEIVFV